MYWQWYKQGEREQVWAEMINVDDLNMFNPGQNQSCIMEIAHESGRERRGQRGNSEKDRAEVLSSHELSSFRRRWRSGQWETPWGAAQVCLQLASVFQKESVSLNLSLDIRHRHLEDFSHAVQQTWMKCIRHKWFLLPLTCFHLSFGE